ncbi:hypothetical protein ACI2LF_03490 [Kribbella sp. NPDC020789]
MTHISRRSVLGLSAAVAVAPLTATLPARATTAAQGFGNDAWALVVDRYPQQSSWNSATDVPRTGYLVDADPEHPNPRVYRSFFRVPVPGLAGTSVSAASLTLLLTRSYTATQTPVELFHVRDLDPSQAVTWENTNSTETWLTSLGVAFGAVRPPQPPQVLSFGGSAATAVVQEAAAQGKEFLTFGLRNPNETAIAHQKTYGAYSLTLMVD